MTILHTADLHFRRSWFDWLAREATTSPVDVTVVAGDFLDVFATGKIGLTAQTRWVAGWLKVFPGRIVVCSGNHDWWQPNEHYVDFQAEGGWLRHCTRPGLVVDGEIADFDGVRFAAVPWAPATWADTAKIVVVHAPPMGLATACAGICDWGDPDVADAVVNCAPQLVLSGHVHHPCSWRAKLGVTWSLNPGCTFEAAFPNHIRIDTIMRQATWISADLGERTVRLS